MHRNELLAINDIDVRPAMAALVRIARSQVRGYPSARELAAATRRNLTNMGLTDELAELCIVIEAER